MFLKVLPFVLISVSVFTYHYSSKLMGTSFERNVWAGLSLTYFLAFVISLLIAIMIRRDALNQIFSLSPYQYYLSLLLALGCVGVECSYLIAYRGGWDITKMYPYASLIVGLTIISVGSFVFKEKLTLPGFFGLLLVLAGVVLMQLK